MKTILIIAGLVILGLSTGIGLKIWMAEGFYAYESPDKSFGCVFPGKDIQETSGPAPALFGGQTFSVEVNNQYGSFQVVQLPRIPGLDDEATLFSWLGTRFLAEPSLGSTKDLFSIKAPNGFIVGRIRHGEKHVFIQTVCRTVPIDYSNDLLVRRWMEVFVVAEQPKPSPSQSQADHQQK